MQFTDAAKALLKRLEGCRLTAYRDDGGVWTIGYGATGTGIQNGTAWTQEQADARLDADLARFIAGVRKELGQTQLPPHRFSAFCIFAYNVGLPAFAGSTALRMAKQGHLEDVPAQLARWNKVKDASGVPMVNRGLVVRRQAEIDLWNSAPSPMGVA